MNSKCTRIIGNPEVKCLHAQDRLLSILAMKVASWSRQMLLDDIIVSHVVSRRVFTDAITRHMGERERSNQQKKNTNEFFLEWCTYVEQWGKFY